MTQKALGFIVNGMLNNEREITEKRIAFILSHMDEKAFDGFTDGFVSSVKVTDYGALFTYMKDRNKSKHLTKIVRAEPQFDGFDAYIRVECKRTVYDESGSENDEVHIDEQEFAYIENVYIYPDSQVPGVSITIL